MSNIQHTVSVEAPPSGLTLAELRRLAEYTKDHPAESRVTARTGFGGGGHGSRITRLTVESPQDPR